MNESQRGGRKQSGSEILESNEQDLDYVSRVEERPTQKIKFSTVMKKNG